jgi:hypothetical protein
MWGESKGGIEGADVRENVMKYFFGRHRMIKTVSPQSKAQRSAGKVAGFQKGGSPQASPSCAKPAVNSASSSII